VFGEANNLASLYRDVSFYPEPLRFELRELLRDYTLYVIYKDWPAHRQGRIFNGGTNRLTMIEYTILRFKPNDANAEILHAQTLQKFSEFVEARQRRLSGVRLQIPGVLWYVVAVGALGNIVLVWMLNMRFFTHMILGGIVAFFLGVVIFLIIAMDRPMRGEVSVQPAAFELVYEVLMQWDEES
jgi:Protein of unknown function (DUF4239)